MSKTRPAINITPPKGKAEPTKGKAEPTKGKAEPTKGKAEPTKGKAEPTKGGGTTKGKSEPTKGGGTTKGKGKGKSSGTKPKKGAWAEWADGNKTKQTISSVTSGGGTKPKKGGSAASGGGSKEKPSKEKAKKERKPNKRERMAEAGLYINPRTGLLVKADPAKSAIMKARAKSRRGKSLSAAHKKAIAQAIKAVWKTGKTRDGKAAHYARKGEERKTRALKAQTSQHEKALAKRRAARQASKKAA